MSEFDPSLNYAQQLDREDDLRHFRDQFWIPKITNSPAGEAEVYFVGNSLGLQPKNCAQFVQEELDKWQQLGVRGHFESERPWLPFHEFLAPTMAKIVGGKETEVVVMNTLTVNLHLMMASFYRPTQTKNKILIEAHAFPSDHYAVESQIRHHGFEPADSMMLAQPETGTEIFDEDQICELIAEHHKTLALVMLPGVQYYTGQFLDMKKITRVCHEHDVLCGFDLAHAAGNVPMQLHDWGVDFAVWCTYKYLNSGPGSVAGCFVHERHATNTSLPRLAGWWGHDKASRFEMKNEFKAIPTAEGWQLSNPPILSLAAIRASLEIFESAGGIAPLREKSLRLTGYFEQLLAAELGDQIKLVTPADPDRRGCQLSLEVCLDKNSQASGKSIHNELEESGSVTDWREPNVIRAAPVPLYNSFEDVYRFVSNLKRILEKAEAVQ
jgi:kynureninase